MAWSHTVSTAFRFTPYQLTLVPGHPTEYLENGHPVAMIRRPVTVTVRGPDGKLAPYRRTLWRTRYGPVFTSLDGLPLPWTASTAFAIRDANAGNLSRAFSTWFGMDRASSTGQVLAVLKKYQGIPWVNTIVSDRQGRALYADIGAIPGVSDAEAAACDTALGAQTFAQLGLPILDGSRTACDWATGPGAAAPGILGPDQEPYLLRRDYVTNSNDSYWLSNPHHPLTGFARIIGDEGTARTLRTRIGLIEVQARIDGTDGLGPAGFTLADMQHLDLSDLDYAAVLTRPRAGADVPQVPGRGRLRPHVGRREGPDRRRLHHPGPLGSALGCRPARRGPVRRVLELRLQRAGRRSGRTRSRSRIRSARPTGSTPRTRPCGPRSATPSASLDQSTSRSTPRSAPSST